MNHSLCPRSQSLSSDGIVQMGPSASAVSIPSSIYPMNKKSINGIKHSQSQQWESTIGGRLSTATTSFGRGAGDPGGETTFIVRRKTPRDIGCQRRVCQPSSCAWVEGLFQRRDCIKFIPANDHSDRCHCGRVSASHSQLALSRFTTSIAVRRGPNGDGLTLEAATKERARWTIGGCTAPSPTDAYGSIQFQGGPHVHKARFVRLSFDSNPADVLRLMVREWGLNMPRLVITVHGGMADFAVPERLGKVFREGLLKAAETTGAWVLTAGVDSGVVKHIARALDEGGISARMRSRIVIVGIAPWGCLRHRERLMGRNVQVPYDRSSSWPSPAARHGLPGGGLVLNDRHSYFLLADNGTVGRYGADIVLRRRLEEYLASRAENKVRSGRSAEVDSGVSMRSRIPIVSVVLEGGLCTLNLVHRYLTGTPSIPVVICEGSGRISDILSFVARHLTDQRIVPTHLRPQLLCHVQKLSCASAPNEQMESVDAILDRLVQCARNRDGLLTIFRFHDNVQSSAIPTQMDHAILHALLQAQNLSPVDQLLMTLAWGREDIARREIFGHGSHKDGSQQIDNALLARPMMEALLMGRAEFVKLFLEQGLSLKRFLTFDRLERLYNAEPEMDALMKNERRGVQRRRRDHRGAMRTVTITLPEIGVAIERLMGNAYRSTYTTREFKLRYERAKFGGIHPLKKSTTRNFSSLNLCLGMDGDPHNEDEEEQGEAAKRKCALASAVGDRMKQAMEDDDDKQYGRERSLLDFEFPFNELMLWAVLTHRHEMAKLFWQYGEEPLAKALIAIRLYKCMSREAAHDYTEVEVSNQLRECANSFRDWSLELLHNCHQQDSQLTMRLLTAELPNWGHRTCLSLAVIANNKRFLAHPCCQILLAELWHGGLRFKSQSNVKVVLGILFPPSILLLDFKTNSADIYSPNAANDGEGPVYDDTEVEEEGGEGRHYGTGTLKQTTIELVKMAQSEVIGDREEEEQLMEGRERFWAEEHQLAQCLCLGTRRNMQMPMEHQPMVASPRQSPVPSIARVLSKFVLFYCAPITSFWIWSISYTAFMLALIFVLLIEFPDEVSPVEWFLFIYVLSFAMEHFRKLFVLESSSLLEKLSVFYNRYWNILTTVSVLSFFLGFLFRFNASTVHTYSRTILASNSVLWHMKLFDFLSVHPRIGPYITMAGKMVLAMSYIIVLLMVTLMAFGVDLSRQSITFPHEKWAWLLVRNIFYKPYFMLYGEVYAGEIDTCGDEGTNCVPGGWIPPVLMTIFLLVANILLINMLIAIFNNIFNVTNAMSQQVWMFQRYEQVLEYKSTPILPPPLTPLAHLLMLLRHLFRHAKQRPSCPIHGQKGHGGAIAEQEKGSFALKMHLPSDELRELQDFEEDCMDDLSRQKIRHVLYCEGWEDGMGSRGERETVSHKCYTCACCEIIQKSKTTDERGDAQKEQQRELSPCEGEEVQTEADGRAHSSLTEPQPFNADSNIGRRQLRVAPMAIMARPQNSLLMLNDDIDQMLLVVSNKKEILWKT